MTAPRGPVEENHEVRRARYLINDTDTEIQIHI